MDSPEKSPERIYLIGMMGSGKTHAGKALASTMGLHFVDLDQEIERSTGLAIDRIFAQKGEQYFRVLERDMLRSTIALSGVVIATGGGAPCFWEGMSFIRTAGVSCYLRANITTLIKRMSASERLQRPLLNGDSRIRLQNLLSERREVYERADVIVDVDELSLEEIAGLLQKQLA